MRLDKCTFYCADMLDFRTALQRNIPLSRSNDNYGNIHIVPINICKYSNRQCLKREIFKNW